MTSTDHERRIARLKNLNTAADDLWMVLCDLDGGPATVQGTPERLAHFRWVHALPRFNHEAQRRALSDPI
jgi:hypothetical protein